MHDRATDDVHDKDLVDLPQDVDGTPRQLQQANQFLAQLNNLRDVEQLEKLFGFLTKQQEKEIVAFALFIAYRDGGANWAPNEQKAGSYLAAILEMTPPESFIENTSFWFSWLTILRLFDLFLNRLLVWDPLRPIPATLPANSPLSGFPDYLSWSYQEKPLAIGFSVCQFSYLLELLVYFISQSMRPETEEDREEHYWWSRWYYRLESRRFWQIWKSEQTYSMVWNALVWGAVNVSCLIFSSAAIYIILAGVVFDFLHSWYGTRYTLKGYENLKNSTLLKDFNQTELKNGIDEKIKQRRWVGGCVVAATALLAIGIVGYFVPLLHPSILLTISKAVDWRFLSSVVVFVAYFGYLVSAGKLNEAAKYLVKLKNNMNKCEGFFLALAVMGVVAGSLWIFPSLPMALTGGVTAITFFLPMLTSLYFIAKKYYSSATQKTPELGQSFSEVADQIRPDSGERGDKHSATYSIIKKFKSLPNDKKLIIQCASRKEINAEMKLDHGIVSLIPFFQAMPKAKLASDIPVYKSSDRRLSGCFPS